MSFVQKVVRGVRSLDQPVDQTKFDQKKWDGYMRDHEDQPGPVPIPKVIKYGETKAECIVIRKGKDTSDKYAKVVCTHCGSLLQTRKYLKGELFLWFHCPVCMKESRRKLVSEVVFVK